MLALPRHAGVWQRWTLRILMVTDEILSSFVAADRDRIVAELFRIEGARLVRLARLFTDDRNAAEDLVQEAFIRLHRAAHRVQDPRKAAPYLRSIVINLARDHNRRGLMSLRHQEAVPAPGEPDVPDDVLAMDEERRVLLDQIRSLSPRQRDCILLRYYLDLSEIEIAETLGISKNSVKTHCRRAMDALRHRVGAMT
jgi:RNA polymerase sigma-70 factor (sigma-E family)